MAVGTLFLATLGSWEVWVTISFLSKSDFTLSWGNSLFTRQNLIASWVILQNEDLI